MKTILKLFLTIITLTLCYQGFNALQGVIMPKDATATTLNLNPVGVQSSFYNMPEVPVYKSKSITSAARRSQDGKSDMQLPTLAMKKSNELLYLSSQKSGGNAANETAIYNDAKTVIPTVSTDSRRVSTGNLVVADGINVYAYSRRSSANESATAANYGFSTISKPSGGSINTLDAGDTGIDPDNGDDDDLPPRLPVSGGMWTLMMMAGVYVVFVIRKKSFGTVVQKG